jgi:hypothetical protein
MPSGTRHREPRITTRRRDGQELGRPDVVLDGYAESATFLMKKLQWGDAAVKKLAAWDELSPVTGRLAPSRLTSAPQGAVPAKAGTYVYCAHARAG